MKKTVQLSIPVIWSYTSQVRKEVDTALKDYPDGIRRAAQTVSSELVENAIKYGHIVPEMPQAKFVLSVSEQELCIDVSSGLSNVEEIKEFAKQVEVLQTATDKEKLLINRMQEIITDPQQMGRLGLIRIVSECRFNLSYEYKNQVLTVHAVRGLHE